MKKTSSKTSASPVGAPTSEQPSSQALVKTVATGTLSDDAVMGAQLTEQYGKAVGGMREVLKLGAMMMVLRDTLSKRGQGSGNGKKGDGVKGWLEVNAPKVNRVTAYRFMNVAIAVSERFALPKKVNFAELATKPTEELPKKLQKKQLELWDFVDGTSRNSWLDQFTPKGGSRERPNGTKRRTRDEKEFDDALGQAMDWYELGIIDLKESYLHSDERWAVLPEVELANVTDLVKLWAKKLDDICRSRKVVPSKLRDWDKNLPEAGL